LRSQPCFHSLSKLGQSQSGEAFVRLRSLESVLESMLVPRHLLRGFPSGNEWHQQPAYSVTLEVELDRYARSRTVVKRLDSAVDVSSHWTVSVT